MERSSLGVCAKGAEYLEYREVLPMTTRREFLRDTAATALSLTAPADLFAQGPAKAPADATWDSGAVVHLLPTANDTGFGTSIIVL